MKEINNNFICNVNVVLYNLVQKTTTIILKIIINNTKMIFLTVFLKNRPNFLVYLSIFFINEVIVIVTK